MVEEKHKGQALATLLAARMRIDGVSMSALAIRLGISQGYLSQLMSGDKPMTGVSENFLRMSASYLGLPAVSCFLMSGRLWAEDFFEAPETCSQQLIAALKAVSDSRHAQDVAVSFEQLKKLPKAIQHLLVLQYESLTGVELMKGRSSRKSIQFAGQEHMPFEVRVVTSG